MKTEYDLISSSKLKIDGQVAPEDILPVKRQPTLSEKLLAKMKSIGKDDLKAHIHQKK